MLETEITKIMLETEITNIMLEDRNKQHYVRRQK